MNRDKVYINQILDAINKIEDYTKGGRKVFFDAIMIQDAVIRNIEVIGEVSKRVSNEFKVSNDNVPWRQMAGIRDVLIHDYDSIDMGIVWNVIALELPKIRKLLSKIE